MNEEQIVEELQPKAYDPFAIDTKKVRADWWSDDDWVIVQEVPYGAVTRMFGKVLAPDGLTQKELEEFKDRFDEKRFDPSNMTVYKTLAGIKEWSFKDRNGNPIPVTQANLERMRAEDAQFIQEAVARLNPDRDASFQD